MSTLEDQVLNDKAFEDAVKDEFDKYMQRVAGMNPDYYARRKYGKWTIYNKDGYRVAWGLNEREKENYMKLLKKEE
jgi:hypothetical protein